MGRGLSGRHVAGVVAVAGLIVAAGFLPFAPGAYDPVAWPLGWAAHAFAIAGLLLVPVGLAWLASEVRRRRRPAVKHPSFAFGIAGWAATGVVLTLVSLATMPTSRATGVIMLVLGWYGLGRLALRLRRPDPAGVNPAPLYLLLVPLIVTPTLVLGHDVAAEHSRTRVADRATEMIAEIERYRDANDRYPESLVAVWPDYLPGVVGVRGYTYERAGDAYALSFEQFRFFPVGTREFVVYSPQDQQTMVSHASWRMLEPGLEGHYASGDAGSPHWRYFWFD